MSLTKVTYSMIQGAPANVLDFGADPTGTNDSTAAIQAAIDSANSVYIPAGEYLLSDTLVDNGETTILYGDGHNDTGVHVTKLTYTTDVVGINFSGFGSQLENICLFGPGGTYTGIGHGIYWQAARGVVQNVTITEFRGHGMYYQKDNCCTFNTITLLDNAGNGLYLDHNPAVVADNNASTFINVDCRINGKSGIADAGNSSFACTFVGATLQGNSEYGLNCYADYYTFIGLYCEANVLNDIQFGSTANYNKVYGYFTNKVPALSSITGNVTGTNYVEGLITRYTPTFKNSWVNYGGAQAIAEYWRDDDGLVHLKGLVKDGTAVPTVIFTLPAGFRPLQVETFATYSDNAFGTIQINQNGDVYAAVGSTASISLSGITFIAEA